jgi:hypothetical protein
MSCEVLDMVLEAHKPSLLRFKTKFVLNGNKKIEDDTQLYLKESWKFLHIDTTLKELNVSINALPVPVFALLLSGGMRVDERTIQLQIDGEPSIAVVNDTVDLLALPDSYPPQRNKTKDQPWHSFYIGKTSVFYAPFHLGKVYELSFDLETYAYDYALATLYPYRFVNVDKFQLSPKGSFSLQDPSYRTAKPIKGPRFPDKQESNWARHLDNLGSSRPQLDPADPMRAMSLVGGSFSDRKPLGVGPISSLELDNYKLLSFRFGFKPPKDNPLHIEHHVTTKPLPVRIYEQLQKLPQYRDFLLSFEISNFGKEDIELEVTSEVLGFTDQSINTFTLYGQNEEGRSKFDPDRPWLAMLAQCPRLKKGMLTKVSKAEEATIKFEIRQIKNGRRTLIKRGTETITFLPRDMIVWSLNDQKSGMRYDLAKMLGSWVSPTDAKGVIDKARGAAKDYHPSGVLVGGSGQSIQSQTAQVKAVYDCLDKKYGIKYVNHAFAFNYDQDGQRVLAPETVIETASGNCIDLSVLFASILEGLGINPLILLMPGHAFLGWGNPHNVDEMDVLECTCIGKSSFEEAQKIAKDNFKKNFFFSGWDDGSPTPNDMLMMSPKKSQIVDFEAVRSEGVNSIPS